MSFKAGSTIARASSGSRSSISSVEPLMSANRAVTVLRSPSIAVDPSDVTRICEVVDRDSDALAGAEDSLLERAVPQSSQNAEVGAFSAPQLEQLRSRGFPHAAQNLLPV